MTVTDGPPPAAYDTLTVRPVVRSTVLLGARHLTLHGGPADAIRAARRVLIFASTVTLALNITEPLITGHYGKAAFDAVGPLLLIGWAEVGPGLLHSIQTTAPPRSFCPTAEAKKPDQPQTSVTPPPITQDRRKPANAISRQIERDTRQQDLLHRARTEDVLHWQHHHRPISAEILRKLLHIGTSAARTLITQLRQEIETAVDSRPPQPPNP